MNSIMWGIQNIMGQVNAEVFGGLRPGESTDFTMNERLELTKADIARIKEYLLQKGEFEPELIDRGLDPNNPFWNALIISAVDDAYENEGIDLLNGSGSNNH